LFDSRAPSESEPTRELESRKALQPAPTAQPARRWFSRSQPVESVVVGMVDQRDEADLMREPTDKMMFITRHGNSCNNISENKFDKRFDPSLSVSGVLTVMALDPPHIQLFRGEDVYVSVCVRTWMTALLLYGKQRREHALTFRVSPFLKEKGTDPGNMPDEVRFQILKFVKFKCFLQKVLELLGSEGAQEKQFAGFIENCLTNHVVITRTDTGDVIYDSRQTPLQCKAETVDAKYIQDTFKSIEESLPTKEEYPFTHGYVPYVIPPTIEVVAPRVSQKGPTLHEAESPGLELDYPVPAPQLNAPYADCMKTFDENGIVYFYRWLSPILREGSNVFVVAHSNLMQKCLEKSFKMLPSILNTFNPKTSGNPDLLFGQNAWTLHVRCRGNTLIPDKYTKGVKKPDESSVVLQHEFICNDDAKGWPQYLPQFFRPSRPSVENRSSSLRTPLLGAGGRKFRSKKRKHNRTFKKK
jgi:hypothetical protein